MFALRWREAPEIEALAASLPSAGRFWFDGTRDHPEGRWAFVGAEPSELRRVAFGARDPLEVFDRLGAAPGDAIEGEPLGLDAGAIPWWVGYVAYDAAWSDPAGFGIREAPRHRRAALPVVALARYEQLFAIDATTGDTLVLAPTEAACRAAIASLGRRPRSHAHVDAPAAEPREMHREAIVRALDAIGAGDIYQVNLARAWSCAYDGEPFALWSAMRHASPVPLGFLFEHSDHAVLGRSMERFVRWDRARQRLWTSPIKGTIARAGSADAREAAVLQADDKERAEHAMIVDLMRNDLSRVADLGTVRLASALRVEPFAALSHLVSTVECRTASSLRLADLMRATFPPGSVTGTPKLRAIELIEAFERRARGVYTGAAGFVDRMGGISLAVAIRTAVLHEEQAVYFAGGGIVSASDPDREIAETELKARVFIEACAALRAR